MINTDNLCMSCMKEIGNEKQCPHCGFVTDSLQLSPYLPIRTVVGNRYIIGKLLEYNGEGATYIAWDITDKRAVTVREYMPDAIAQRRPDGVSVSAKPGCELSFRDCGQNFVELWSKLIRLSGLSALICASDIIEDLGTVYAVSEYCDGMTLREYLLGSKTGYITWEKARQLFMPVLSTLGTLHTNGIIHRGISPLTLIIGRDGKMRISGFCIPQVRTARGDLNAQLFPGYAAVEQYGFKGQQGPWTDIYAFAAALYRALIGSDPIEATTRVTNDRLMVPGKFAEQLPAYVINGLVNALQIMPEDRTRTVEQLRAEITASPTAAAAEEKFVESRRATESTVANTREPVRREPVAPIRQPAPTRQPAPPAKSRGSALASSVKVAVICVLIGLVAFVVLSFTVFPEEYNVLIALFEKDETTVAEVPDEKVIVPNFVGKSYTDVVYGEYYNSRFNFTAEYVFSDDVEMGYIISQSINEATEVDVGTTIKVVVSKGIEKILLPDVVGQNYDIVYEQLTELGFVVSKTDKANDGSHAEGEIAAMSKTAELQYEIGEKIVLQVYDAPVTDSDDEPETEAETTHGE